MSSTSNWAQGISVDNGAITSRNLGRQTKCGINVNKVKSTIYKFKAPPSGTVTVSAICGDSGIMNSAPKLTLTLSPTSNPRQNCNPTTAPTKNPTTTSVPSTLPTNKPSQSSSPTLTPTKNPVKSTSPTATPTTVKPTSSSPTLTPTIPTKTPTFSPLKPHTPTKAPVTKSPTIKPSTHTPTHLPTSDPITLTPSVTPTTVSPTSKPTQSPIKVTKNPSSSPVQTNTPSSSPSVPTTAPTFSPSVPTKAPTKLPTKSPIVGVKNLGGLGTDDFSILYEPTHDVTSFILENKDKGWIGIGIPSPTGNMVGGKAIIGMDPTINKGYSAVQIYNLGSKDVAGITPLSTDTTLESAYGIVNASFSVGATSSILKFSIIVDKQNDNFKMVSKDKPTIIYAYGDSEFGPHDFRGTVLKADFTEDGTTTTAETPIYNVPVTIMLHAAMMIIAFLVLFPLGVSMPLYNNKKFQNQKLCGLKGAQWFKAHKYIQMLGLVLAIIGFISIIVYVDSVQDAHFDDDHKNLGLAVIIGSILNPLYGFLRPHKPEAGEKKSFLRSAFEWLHPLFGYAVIICGFANCFMGVESFEEVVGGEDYTYNGQIGETGFGGAIGIAVIVLGVLFMFPVALGLLIRLIGRITNRGLEESSSAEQKGENAGIRGDSTLDEKSKASEQSKKDNTTDNKDVESNDEQPHDIDKQKSTALVSQ